MKTRLVKTIFVAAIVSVLLVSGGPVEARPDLRHRSTIAVETLFGALSAGDVDAALTIFEDGAIVKDGKAGNPYVGADQIAGMLGTKHREGRQFEVRHREVINLARDLDLVISDVDIADRGVLWAREKIVTTVYDGQIQNMIVTGFRLLPVQRW